MSSSSALTASNNTNMPHRPNIIEPYLQKALSSLSETDVGVFNQHSNSGTPINAQGVVASWPKLRRNKENQILLFPGSFNPPHQGHLATIRYFHVRREQLGIVAMFIFADPDEVIRSKKKKWGKIVLPQELRNTMFTKVPELSSLIEDRWLYFLIGDMETHIQLLRNLTDLISEARFNVKLVGLLGGDKLSIDSPPHLPPGDLPAWGPVDQFLIMNARRPVDFYDPDAESKQPQNLLGCTEWERIMSDDDSAAEEERGVGVLWLCRALTVPGEPLIQFRASKTSASNGISSTRIRRIMSETPVEELYERLRDQVLSTKLLVEYLGKSRDELVSS